MKKAARGGRRERTEKEMARKAGLCGLSIQQAVKKAQETKGFMYRGSSGFELVLQPTDSPDCCRVIGVGLNAGREPKPRWNPRAEDLAARDWVVIQSVDEFPLRS